MSMAESSPPMKPSPLAMASFVVGLIALLFAGLDFFVGPLGLHDSAVASEAASEPRGVGHWMTMVTILSGLIALLLAGVAFMRKEDHRICVVGAAFGLSAILFQFSLIGTGILMLALLIWLVWPVITA